MSIVHIGEKKYLRIHSGKNIIRLLQHIINTYGEGTLSMSTACDKTFEYEFEGEVDALYRSIMALDRSIRYGGVYYGE